MKDLKDINDALGTTLVSLGKSLSAVRGVMVYRILLDDTTFKEYKVSDYDLEKFPTYFQTAGGIGNAPPSTSAFEGGIASQEPQIFLPIQASTYDKNLEILSTRTEEEVEVPQTINKKGIGQGPVNKIENFTPEVKQPKTMAVDQKPKKRVKVTEAEQEKYLEHRQIIGETVPTYMPSNIPVHTRSSPGMGINQSIKIGVKRGRPKGKRSTVDYNVNLVPKRSRKNQLSTALESKPVAEGV